MAQEAAAAIAGEKAAEAFAIISALRAFAANLGLALPFLRRVK